ncbi:hypothetical protein [Arthrobacter sp. L77]|uniref:hypothetical protein n=1 Tax=Arthrobacter sp. L77 TaxID=1496689 RepID=UPI0005BA45C0|nr:hypothetical protein [Arthrobacter sp. L77]
MWTYPRYETVSFLRAAGAGYIEGLVLMRYAQKAVEDRGLASRERVVHVEVWGEETCGMSSHQGHPVDLTVENKAIYWYRVTIEGPPEGQRLLPDAAVPAGSVVDAVDHAQVEGAAAP